MKKLFYLLLLIGFYSHSQTVVNSNSFSKNLRSFTSVYHINYKPNTLVFNFKQKNNYFKSDIVSVYNSVTNLNYNYIIVGEKYYLNTIKIIPHNSFDPFNVTLLNPNLTKDFKGTLLLSAVNLLFNN